MKKIVVIGVFCIVIIVFFSLIVITKPEEKKELECIYYKEMELNRAKLYLQENFKYMLKLQYSNVDDGNCDMDNVEIQNLLGKKITWRSSDETIAKVDSNGTISAIKLGTTNITAKIEDVTYSCEVIIISKDMGVPIEFKNDFFTEEIYNQIDKIMVMTASGTQPIEIFDKYSISFIYSMLSEIESIDVYENEPENIEDKPIGVGTVVIVLKSNKQIVIESHKFQCISFEGKYYKYVYGLNYGKRTDLFYELRNFVKNI